MRLDNSKHKAFCTSKNIFMTLNKHSTQFSFSSEGFGKMKGLESSSHMGCTSVRASDPCHRKRLIYTTDHCFSVSLGTAQTQVDFLESDTNKGSVHTQKILELNVSD